MRKKAFARLCLFLLLTGFAGAGLTGCVMDPDGTDPPPEQPLDRDDDGVADDDDQCLDTPDGAAVNEDGCADSQLDSDGDGVSDDVDECPGTAAGASVDDDGCPDGGLIGLLPNDNDSDGVGDAADDCPNTPAGATVDVSGCAANQRDTDGDGVTDNIDQCANTPAGSEVDGFGCASGQLGASDDDDDGVPDDVDACLETPAGAIVDADGCTASQLDDDNDGVSDATDQCPNTPDGSTVDADGCAANQLDSDNDGVPDGIDRCPNTAAGTTVDRFGCPTGGGGGGGTTPVCGNGVVESGEQCEPPGIACCDENCQNVSGGTFSADNCSEATALCDDEGTFAFDNTSATQDGPPHTQCIAFGEDRIDNDVWACWTAPCTGTVFVSTCDLSSVDTKIAVYDGCTCPVMDGELLSCNDDICDVQSITSFEAAAGQSYLIRLGTFPGETGGTGAVSITCGVGACPSVGDCSASHDTPGCDNEDCCETVCAVDPFCCDVAEGEWDGICADEAAGFCDGSFAACAAGAGSCTDPDGNGTPGCEDLECCNAVCLDDSFCCVDEWDDVCSENEAAICFSTCGPRQGDCFARCSGGTNDGNLCTGKCSGGTNDGNLCTDNAECPGGTCGATRCSGGTNDGNLCTDNAECPGGTCGVTRCNGGTNDGNLCTGRCSGGTNDGNPCTDEAECPEGTCEDEAECPGGTCEDEAECPGGTCEGGNSTPGCEIESCCAEVCPRDSFCCQVEWDDTCAERASELCSSP